jgi:hypothetical protein
VRLHPGHVVEERPHVLVADQKGDVADISAGGGSI